MNLIPDKDALPQISLVLIALIFQALHDFKDLFPGLEGRESTFILGAMLIILWTVINQQKLIKEKEVRIKNALYQKIEQVEDNIDQKTGQKIDYLDRRSFEVLIREKVGLITDISDNKDNKIFEGFVGEYWTLNAPLKYEIQTENLDLHTNRYKDGDFKKAHYCYPIFAHPEPSIKDDWIRNVKNFCQTLYDEGNLKDEERLKVAFYVPRRGYQYPPNLDITYFIGNRQSSEEAIIYIHNNVFTNMREGKDPRRMLVVYDELTITELRRQIQKIAADQGMRRLDGIDKFLDYFKDNE